MITVYFKGYGSLYACGKVRKDYNIGDTFKLKGMASKLIVIDKKEKEIHVKPIDWEKRLNAELGITS